MPQSNSYYYQPAAAADVAAASTCTFCADGTLGELQRCAALPAATSMQRNWCLHRVAMPASDGIIYDQNLCPAIDWMNTCHTSNRRCRARARQTDCNMEHRVSTMKLDSQQLAALPRTSTVPKSPVTGSYRATCSAAVELILPPHTSQALAAEGGFHSAPVLAFRAVRGDAIVGLEAGWGHCGWMAARQGGDRTAHFGGCIKVVHMVGGRVTAPLQEWRQTHVAVNLLGVSWTSNPHAPITTMVTCSTCPDWQPK